MRAALFILCCFFGATFVLDAEPSAFELQSGATKKDISTLRSSSRNLQNITTDVQVRLGNVERMQDGLKSLVEGQNPKIKLLSDQVAEMKVELEALVAKVQSQATVIRDYQDAVDELKSKILKQQDDTKRIQDNIRELTESVSKSNDFFARQLDLLAKTLASAQQVELPKPSKEDVKKAQEKKYVEELSKKDPNSLFDEARSLMRTRDYDSAEKILKFLVTKNHRVAEVYFMLGDVAFSKKAYKDSVSLYKKSFEADPNAKYMPVMLWRTAWSFKYLNNEAEYAQFADMLIKLYPNTEQAKRMKKVRQKEQKEGELSDWQ